MSAVEVVLLLEATMLPIGISLFSVHNNLSTYIISKQKLGNSAFLAILLSNCVFGQKHFYFAEVTQSYRSHKAQLESVIGIMYIHMCT